MAASSWNQHHGPSLLDQGLPSLQQLLSTEGKAVEEETRDWAELPLDALLNILRRLDVIDIFMAAGHVCRPWRRATEEEPELWRHIDMRHLAKNRAYDEDDIDLRTATRAAVTRSSGRCQAFWAQDLDVDRDQFFHFLADALPQLKSLRLILCKSIISERGLIHGIRKFHMLEELELSLHSAFQISSTFSLAETCSAAAEACPLLRHLWLNKYHFHRRSRIGDTEAMEIGKMRSLQVLQLFGNSLGNVGLTAILHGCVRLESLDIRHCFNVEMNGELRAACARLHTLRPPHDSLHDYDLSCGSPEMERGPERPFVFRWVDGDLTDPDPCGNPGSDWYWH